MSKCWIKTDYVPEYCDYLTVGKWYEVDEQGEDGECIVDDEGVEQIVNYPRSAHLDGKAWQVYYGDTPPSYGDTPPDFLQEPKSNDKESGDSGVAGEPSASVNEDNYDTEAMIGWLSDACSKAISNTVLMNKKDIEDFIDKLKSGEYSVIRNVK